MSDTDRYQRGKMMIETTNEPGGIGVGSVQLPHQCSHWTIGGAVEVRQLIEDLQAALKVLEGEEPIRFCVGYWGVRHAGDHSECDFAVLPGQTLCGEHLP